MGKVLIARAGPTGLVLALWLTRQGLDSYDVERRAFAHPAQSVAALDRYALERRLLPTGAQQG
ncbi:MAG: FAD-dependent monooxygenase [Alcaligenaceae bacterium]|nr:FAD-dependent monooxygenase [Alcaligenaceae bacterium]